MHCSFREGVFSVGGKAVTGKGVYSLQFSPNKLKTFPSFGLM